MLCGLAVVIHTTIGVGTEHTRWEARRGEPGPGSGKDAMSESVLILYATKSGSTAVVAAPSVECCGRTGSGRTCAASATCATCAGKTPS